MPGGEEKIATGKTAINVNVTEPKIGFSRITAELFSLIATPK